METRDVEAALGRRGWCEVYSPFQAKPEMKRSKAICRTTWIS